ncbi:hypothetical protein [Streptomyces sp. NPDC060194]|uniref:hypothetical protein n=1 Tax=Streptomyces sp. NPDC060194 TaxID=3347069 RepID=UPI00364C91CC
MKPTKVAAVVAGTVMALGAASPAMAAGHTTPTSLTGGLETLTSELNSQALQNDVTDGTVVEDVKHAAQGLGSASESVPLLGGLPLGK